MQSHIETFGYGYRKRLCQDAATWFLNKFLPRHKIYLEIAHRGLKREGVYGYCDFIGESRRPRDFLIELDTYMPEDLYIRTLFHELTHVRQWVVGSLRFRYGKMCYCKEPVEKYEYWHQPHEIEARQQEAILYLQYLNKDSKESIAFFPNRLMGSSVPL